MKLLLHACCGPCSIYPVSVLKDEGITFTAYFYNPNIHPFKEFKKRINALSDASNILNFQLITEKDYELTMFLRKVVNNERHRCNICYDLRLLKTVEYAVSHGFDAFTTTLLYSKYQKHSLLVDKCRFLSEKFNIKFYYRDFRKGWQFGIDESKRLELYRQRYCGCIYSEQEAFDKKFRKSKRSKIITEQQK